MFRQLFETIFSIFCSGDDVVTPKKATVEVKPKRVRFRSLFVLGQEFFKFHENVETRAFVEWLKKNHDSWYKNNKPLAESFIGISFNLLVEQLYDSLRNQGGEDALLVYFRKWYVQEHGIFFFSTGDRVFVPLFEGGHLLQVLYNIPENEIIHIEKEEDISIKLPSPEDYRNNWFVGTESGGHLESLIAEYLIAKADIQTTHYKLISNNKDKNKHYIELLSTRSITNFVEVAFQAVTTIPNDAITVKRFNRYEQFNDFAERSEGIFKQFLTDTSSAKRFDDFFMLNVWNDKNHPKNNVTYVNVAFGSRPLTVSHHNKGFSSTVEEGARLTFYRMETGQVTVTLYPAKTDSRKPLEDAIVLCECIDPKDLSDEKKLKKYWNDLVSYMECTTIDGNPTFSQKRRVSRLRFVKHLIIDNVYQSTNKRTERWQDIKKFVLTVGLSGFLFYIIQFCYNLLNPDTTQQKYHQEMINHIDSLQDVVRQTGYSLGTKILQSKNKINEE